MKKIIIYYLIFQFTFVAAMLVVPLFMDKQYLVEETVEIQASPAKVRANIVDFRAWREWHAYSHKISSRNRLRMKSPTTGPGAALQWESPGSYDGTLTMDKIQPGGLFYSSEFEKQFRAKGSITWKREGKMTLVTWREQGGPGLYIARLFNPVFGYRIREDMKMGLDGLKDLCER